MKVEELVKLVLAGNRRGLAKAITLIESIQASQRPEADRLLAALMPHTGQALRIGISGVPGVGKSTFIDSFGCLLADKGHKVAVLAVDPSSPISHGSILGDKTRMATLANHPNSFIRPSPTGGSLGGVTRRTRESILICEAAGFDHVLVETVGVGQSEYVVQSMVDVFIMLQIPGAGDELQGIKKGILELADVIAVTKADGSNVNAAKRTKIDLTRALQLVKSQEPWVPPVLLTSGLKKTGLDAIETALTTFIQKQKETGELVRRRKQQALAWFDAELSELLKERLYQNPAFANLLAESQKSIVNNELAPSTAARQLLDAILPISLGEATSKSRK